MLLDSYIKSYLDISVVLGIGICHSKVIKSLYLNDCVNQSSERTELVAKLNHTLFNSPSEGDFYEAPFINYHLYLHNLRDQYEFITLVLHDNNVIKSFRAQQLQKKLQKDIKVSLDIFEELSTQRTLLGKTVTRPTDDKSTHSPESDFLHNITVEDAVVGLNALSKIVSQYIGPKIIANYLNQSKPNKAWLKKFEIQGSGAIVFQGQYAERINPIQMLSLREWTQNFMKQCQTIILDLPECIEKAGLSDKHRKILSIYTSNYLHNPIISTQQNESLLEHFERQ